MPPKHKPPSASTELVPVGPRHLAAKNHIKRDDKSDKPSTARALVLRNGKHGARGTGELMLVTKLTGREKLDLLAEDLLEKSKKAISTPFRLEACLKIAGSQYDAFLDDIANLKDHDLFFHIIKAELSARTPYNPNKADPTRNPSYVASVVATRIHNAYMLASAWKIVSDTLNELAEHGLNDQNVKTKLKSDPNFRSRYLALFNIVSELVNISQAKFSVLATTTPHYAQYFKQAEQSEPGDPEIVFDWAGPKIREACTSFLDSIIIELCFPRAPYPKAVLYQVLRDAVSESPREAKRFPQALWDAVGDLSISVELQQLLEAPLLSPEGRSWQQSSLNMPKEYERWIDAQIYSEKASLLCANYKDLIFPLEQTKKKVVLESMWKHVNDNYKTASAWDIDTLWQLSGALNRTPQWHSFYMPDAGDDSDSDLDDMPGLTSLKGAKKASKRLAITNGAADDSEGSMPELQSVSNSSDEDESVDDSDSEDDSDEEEDDDEGYNTDEEDELREMLRAAMDAAHDAEDIFSPNNVHPELDASLEEDRKGNPFLKLLGSLKGRMFSSNPKLRATTRPTTKSTSTREPLLSGTKPVAAKSTQPTIEEVEDEDEDSHTRKKKKKKPKKKKKLTSPESQPLAPSVMNGPVTSSNASPQSPQTPVQPPVVPSSPVSPTKKPKAPRQPVPPAKVAASQMSTTSLPLPIEPTTAQSARSYLQSENLDTQKTKIKSRPDHASLFSNSEKKGFLSRLGVGRNKSLDEPVKGAKHSWFSKLGKKTKGYMHQLLNTSEDDTKGIAPMKWENFLKLMREMGFEYDPSTAGSSVRFDPPDPRDKPITFHKPHPDPTLQPIMLKNFGKRLKSHYGWTEEDFLKQLS